MSEVVNGVEGQWVPAIRVEFGQTHRITGTWEGSGYLSLREGERDVILDSNDRIEVFVPNEPPKPVLPGRDGVYADVDGDLWNLFNGKWTLLGDEGTSNYTPESYLPMRHVLNHYGNFGDEVED